MLELRFMLRLRKLFYVLFQGVRKNASKRAALRISFRNMQRLR